ncbi:MAG: gamma-glutamyltransferase, partial [Blastocatellia bacterium]
MRSTHKVIIWSLLLGGLALTGLVTTRDSKAQEQEERATSRTMRPVIRGRYYAAASMKAEATRAAERILEAGGNAFDAIVAGQAALAVVDAAANGVGSDAVILVYDARAKKVFSINAEGTAPKLATIEWYQKNQGGKLPDSDG